MLLTIQTTDGPAEVDATVRPSGLAIHGAEPKLQTYSANRGTVTYVTTAKVSHVASGMFICRAFNMEFAALLCRRLERSGVDWTRPREVIGADRDAEEAVRAATWWQADKMLRRSKLGIDLRQGYEEATKEAT